MFTFLMRKTRKEIRSEKAEIVCRELRYQLSNKGLLFDPNLISEYLIEWIKYAKKNKYERPKC